MAMHPIKCPKCGGVAEKSTLTSPKYNVSCSHCSAKFDVKITSDSRNTGRYTISNVH